MDIRQFKVLIGNLPDVISAEQFELIRADFNQLDARIRTEVEDELAETLKRVEALQAKLGRKPDPEPSPRPATPARRPQSGGDYTDADLGIGSDEESGDEGMSLGAFRAELTAARASGASKRRRLS